MHGRCLPANPVAFHWALPAEPYKPQHQNVGPTSLLNHLSIYQPVESMLAALWVTSAHMKMPLSKAFPLPCIPLNSWAGRHPGGQSCCDTIAFQWHISWCFTLQNKFLILCFLCFLGPFFFLSCFTFIVAVVMLYYYNGESSDPGLRSIWQFPHSACVCYL